MAVRKQSSGKWLAEIYPEGRPGKENPKAPRIRKQFATKGEALAFERFVLDPDKGKPWLEGQGGLQPADDAQAASNRWVVSKQIFHT